MRRSGSNLSGGDVRRSRQQSFKVLPGEIDNRYAEHKDAKQFLEEKTNRVMALGIFFILASIAMLAVGAMHIRGFIEHTTEVLNPPPGTPAYEAQQQFDKVMPAQALVSYFNVFLTSKHSPVRAVPTLCAFLDSVQKQLSTNEKTRPHFQHMGQYCFLKGMDMNLIADHLVAPTNDSVTAPILANVSRFDPAARTFSQGVEEIVAAAWPILLNETAFRDADNTTGPKLSNETRKYYPLSSLPVTRDDFTIGINGLTVFLASIAETSKRDLIRANYVVMPVVVLLLFVRFRGSLSLVLLLLFAAGGHFCSSLGAMRLVANDMSVSAPTPLLMFCLGIGLSLLFSVLIVTEFSRRVRAYYIPLFDAFQCGVPPNEFEQKLLDNQAIQRHRALLSPSKRRRYDSRVRRQLALKRRDDEEQQQRQKQQLSPSPKPHQAAAAAARGAGGGGSDFYDAREEEHDGDAENEVAFDEALFHENLDHARCDVIVDLVMNSCGEISVAALAVLCSSVCIVFFPASIIQSLGVGCIMTVTAAWFYSVVVLVALLFCGFPYFAHCCFCSSTWWALEQCVLPARLKSCMCGPDNRGVEAEDALLDDDDCLQECMDNCGESSSDYDSDDDDDGENYCQRPQQQNQPQTSLPSSSSHQAEAGADNNNSRRIQNSSAENSMATVASAANAAAAVAAGGERAPLLGNSFGAGSGGGSFSAAGAVSPQQQLFELRKAVREPIVERKLSAFHAATYWVRFALALGSLGVLAWVATGMRLSNSYAAYLGREAEATKNYKSFTSQYGYGMVSPFRILMYLNEEGLKQNFNITIPINKTFEIGPVWMGVFNDIFWTQAQQIVKNVIDDPVLGNATHMAGPLVVGPHLTNGREIFRCLITMDSWLKWLQPWLCPDETITAFTMGNTNLKTRNAMYLMMTAKFNPLGVDGYKMLERVRRLTQPVPGNATHPNIVATAVQGDGPSSLDTVHAIYQKVPVLAPVSVCAATLIVLLFSRSLIDAVRFAFGLAWGLSVTMGASVLVYQNGWLGWLGMQQFAKITGGGSPDGEGEIPWIGPLIVFAIALGLLTCYDVLATKCLAAGRRELIWEIHFCAVLMIVAFAGLVSSEVPLMNLVGFALIMCGFMAGFAVPRELSIPVYAVLGNKIVKHGCCGGCVSKSPKPCPHCYKH